MFLVNPGILVNLYASAHHPYTTLATGKWMTFWPSKDSPIKVGCTECSCHLEIPSSLHVRLLPATLQISKHYREVIPVKFYPFKLSVGEAERELIWERANLKDPQSEHSKSGTKQRICCIITNQKHMWHKNLMQNLLRNPPSYAMQALASITFTKKLLMAILYKCFNSNKQIWEQAWGQIL